MLSNKDIKNGRKYVSTIRLIALSIIWKSEKKSLKNWSRKTEINKFQVTYSKLWHSSFRTSESQVQKGH